MLNERLEGYKEYTQKTRYKLIPGIWLKNCDLRCPINE